MNRYQITGIIGRERERVKERERERENERKREPDRDTKKQASILLMSSTTERQEQTKLVT